MHLCISTRLRSLAVAALWTACLSGGAILSAQETPLISGGVGFITITNGGNTTYTPIINPLLAAPLGDHFLVESRATILESFFPKGGGQSGYTSSSFLGLSYLQLDYLATPHLTVVGGEFLVPFGTYNERLSPIWISNFESSPIILPLGTMNTGSGVGGMLRGSAMSTGKVSLDYAGYFSAASTNEQFNSQRSTGGRADLYFPQTRLEIGGSYGRLLEGQHQNFEGVHLWWEPADALIKFRSEYAHGEHSQGYWMENEFHLTRSPDANVVKRVLVPVVRWQQAFRNSPDSSDGLPPEDTNRVDFGLNFLFPHNLRINSSYSRQFASSGNLNAWGTGIIYRFMFPTWKGK